MEAQLRQARKLEAIGTLAGGIAHEFNNILGIIIGNTELAMDDTPEWKPVRQNLDEIKQAGLRARDVVKQLLNFSRKAETHNRPIDIEPIVRGSLKLLRASIPATVDIQSSLDKNIHSVVADPTLVHQLLYNLGTNAAHAMDAEGGVLKIQLENVDIDAEDAAEHADLQAGSYARLVVSDTGHGIEPKLMDQIFDPFFTTKEVGKGTGMGLAVVHGIVTSLGGTIVVDSKVKKGTTFSIFLPAASGDAQKEVAVQKALPTGSERILFVDDENSLATMGGEILTRLGYQGCNRNRPRKGPWVVS